MENKRIVSTIGAKIVGIKGIYYSLYLRKKAFPYPY